MTKNNEDIKNLDSISTNLIQLTFVEYSIQQQYIISNTHGTFKIDHILGHHISIYFKGLKAYRVCVFWYDKITFEIAKGIWKRNTMFGN